MKPLEPGRYRSAGIAQIGLAGEKFGDAGVQPLVHRVRDLQRLAAEDTGIDLDRQLSAFLMKAAPDDPG